MEKTAAISAAKLQAKIGRTLPVLIDAADDEGGATGRSQADAPEIDGEVHLRDAHGLKAGDRSEEHTSELQSLMSISYAVFCLTNNKHTQKAQLNTPRTR